MTVSSSNKAGGVITTCGMGGSVSGSFRDLCLSVWPFFSFGYQSVSNCRLVVMVGGANGSCGNGSFFVSLYRIFLLNDIVY